MKDKLKRLLKKEKLEVDPDNVLSRFAQDLNFDIRGYRIKRIFNRPFSVVVNIVLPKQINLAIFVKIYKLTDVQRVQHNLHREFEITQYWFKKFNAQEYFHTIEPLWVDFNNLILITKEFNGINLLSFLEQRIRFLPSSQNIRKAASYLTLAGRWLAFYQRHPIEKNIPYLDQSIYMNLDYFLDYINIRMERIVSNPHINFDAKMQRAVNEAITFLWSKVGGYKDRYCVSHSDFSLSNILIRNNQVTVLDFHTSEVNSPFKDLSRLYHQLLLFSFKPDYQRKIIGQLQTALLDGWGKRTVDQNPLFRIFFLIHQINHLGKTARYWEHNFMENMYNRWVVRKSLKHLKEFIAREFETKN